MGHANVQNIGGPKTQAWKARQTSAVTGGFYVMHPIVIERGAGPLVYDVDGNVFLDFLSGVGVNAVGHCHPRVVAAVQEQTKHLMAPNNHVGISTPYIEFLEKLQSTCPGDLKYGKGFLSNSGTEAVEAALKLSWATQHKPNIIHFDPCFHGRTYGSVQFTTGGKGKKNVPGAGFAFSVPYPYSYRAPFEGSEGDYVNYYIGRIEDLLSKSSPPENTAAVIMETIAGEPGVIVPPKGFHPALRKLCDEKGILYIADEVQMGVGKTGRWWGVDHFDVVPDIMTFAKAAGGALPLGGIIAKKEIADAWPVGHHASTFGGNAVACASGMATMQVIEDEKLLERARTKGEYVLKRFHEMADRYQMIGDVRGIGMIFGLELVKDNKKTPAAAEAGKIKDAAFRRGLLASVTGPYSNVVRLSPALNTPDDVLGEGLEILEAAFKEVCA